MHPRAALRAALAALGARGVSPTGRAIYSALWTFADPRGRAWPSQETLARMTGRCVRTVRSAVNELARVRVIVRDVPDLRERRRCRRTTAYLLLPLPAVAAPPGRPGAPPAAPASAGGSSAALAPPPPSGAPCEAPQLAPDPAAPSLTWDGAEDVTVDAVEVDAHQLAGVEVDGPAVEAPAAEAPPVLEQGAEDTAAERDPSREYFGDGAAVGEGDAPAAGEDLDAAANGCEGEHLVNELAGLGADVPAPAPPPSITGNLQLHITGNRRREKTQGMNTSARRPPRPSPFATGRPPAQPAGAGPGPVQALPAPLASILARCRALARRP